MKKICIILIVVSCCFYFPVRAYSQNNDENIHNFTQKLEKALEEAKKKAPGTQNHDNIAKALDDTRRMALRGTGYYSAPQGKDISFSKDDLIALDALRKAEESYCKYNKNRFKIISYPNNDVCAYSQVIAHVIKSYLTYKSDVADAFLLITFYFNNDGSVSNYKLTSYPYGNITIPPTVQKEFEQVMKIIKKIAHPPLENNQISIVLTSKGLKAN